MDLDGQYPHTWWFWIWPKEMDPADVSGESFQRHFTAPWHVWRIREFHFKIWPTSVVWFGLVYGDEIDSIDPKDSADAGDEHPKFQAIWVRKPAKTWGSILGFACRRTPEAVTEPQACCAALARLQQLGIATEVDIDPWKTSTPVPSNMPGWGIPQLNGHVPSGKLT